MQFTPEQIKVIETHDKNILVSAAAGSGKTAVLVERIIQMLLREEAPINVDQLLVVTFTNAAASEMRERIGDAIEARLEQDMENPHLQRQLALLSSASIMTVHAFCLKIIKSHFDKLNLDPGFRIADENELMLIKQDVLKDILETFYEEADEAFIEFVECYASGKTDEGIETLIFDCHRFAMSNPWPKAWLEDCCTRLNIKNQQDFENSLYYEQMMKLAKARLLVAAGYFEKAGACCEQPEGPVHYTETVSAYREVTEGMLAVLNEGMLALKNRFDAFEPFKLSAKRTGFDKTIKEMAKDLIDKGKDILVTLKKDLFGISMESMIEDIQGTWRSMSVLAKVTAAFDDAFAEAKQDKGLIDFNDIEHFALQILITQDEDGRRRPSEIAGLYQEQYVELLLDEYQDTNLVQETILQSVSRENRGRPNTFMVGDVKQSIYKFRLAKPELFMEKYDSYQVDQGEYRRLYLGKNFRSRHQVLGAVNDLFEQLMTPELGDVVYDDLAALHPGAVFEPVDESGYVTEMIFVQSESSLEDDEEALEDEESSEEADESSAEAMTLKEAEATAIGKRILELVDEAAPMQLWDKEKKCYRKPNFRDIVILLRSNAGWTEPFQEVLGSMQIPTYTDTKSGYLDTIEIRTMLNLLQLIDNPRQDIPLIAVLRSPIVGLKGADFVRIRTAFDDGEFYEALLQFIEGSVLDGDALAEKLEVFLEQLKRWRRMAQYLPMDDLLKDIFEKTRYMTYMMLMPAGRKRQANLEMLIDRAIAFEESSYRGVFQFVRYVEQIKKYEQDMGEATVLSESDDVVRIMSIHKSKGLEFPIVFVAGLGKLFNKQDLHRNVLFHQDLGIGADYVNPELRFKSATLPKQMIKARIERELLSEELRVLYVALTRAKEKLIMTGAVKDLNKRAEKWYSALQVSDRNLPYSLVSGARCYLDWIGPALMRHPSGSMLRNSVAVADAETAGFGFDTLNAIAVSLRAIDLTKSDPAEAGEGQNRRLSVVLDDWKERGDLQAESALQARLEWEYPYRKRIGDAVQMSVSELKRMQYEEEWMVQPAIDIRPVFISEDMGITAAQKGTAFHKVMCGIDFNIPADKAAVNHYLADLADKGILTRTEQSSVPVQMIVDFLKHPICRRMIDAGGSLRRELPFVLGIDAEALEVSTDENEDIVMVQGVIDAFFEEEGGWILLDYKTDYFEADQDWKLRERYRVQMNYYKKALEQITGQRVKETWIYGVRQSMLIAMD